MSNEPQVVEITEANASDPALILNYEDITVHATFSWASTTTLSGARFQVEGAFQVQEASFIDGIFQVTLGTESTEPMVFVEFEQLLVEEQLYQCNVDLNHPESQEVNYGNPKVNGTILMRPKLG